MSFPPPPPMIAPGYFAPMGVGMVPVGMTHVMMPAPPVKIVTPHIPLPPPSEPEVPKEKPPVTTVFVGNISDRAPDNMIKLMLQRCGTVLSWKRVQGASGRLQAFGFCEYEKPESTLRCIRLLNERLIGEKRLVVKVDAKTKTLLDEYLKKKKQAAKALEDGKQDDVEIEEGEDTTENGDDELEQLDEASVAEDCNVKIGLDRILIENSIVLSKEVATPPADDIKSRLLQKGGMRRNDEYDTSMDMMDMAADRKVQISQEIRSFRDQHKDEKPSSPKPDRNEREFEPRNAEDRRLRDSQRLRDRELYKARVRAQRSRTKSKSPPSSSRSSSDRRRSRSRDRDRAGRSRDRSPSRDKERRDRERAIEIEEEAHERRKLEKKLREKEAAYRERLKAWETREGKKHREYRKERDREVNRKDDEEKEARRLKEFLEDYDDERDDVKYYKAGPLQRRLKDREKEIELDDRDRAREKDELEEIKLRLQEEGHPDVEAEIFKLERQRNEHLRPRPIKVEVKEPPRSRQRHKSSSPDHMKPEIHQNTDSMDSSISNQEGPSEPPVLKPLPTDIFASDSPTIEAPQLKAEEPPPAVPPPMFKPIAEVKTVAELSAETSPTDTSVAKRKKLTVGDVFNQDEEEDTAVKKRKLIPLDYTEDKEVKKPKTIEEKRAHIKTLIERIPTAKEELFKFPLDWAIVDTSLMDKRIKPWVNKKIVEYIGEEEPTLTDFICQKVIAKSSPQKILNDVAMVLDEEAEVFIVKMWRLLIYETEAKKAGLVK